jgi:uncharacterized repeat protein (TIGR01451 family)
VRIFVDGVDLGQCFTTWENDYRTSPEQKPPPNVNTPANLKSLQLRSSKPGFALPGSGFLFDNVTVTTANGAGPPGCDDVIVKTADQRTVRAGSLAGYQITARNRGTGSDRNVRVCDRIPRGTRFVRSDRMLRAVGTRRCLLIPLLRAGQSVSFHVTLRVNANAAPGTKANTADITPAVTPTGTGAVSGIEAPSQPAAPARASPATRPRRRAPTEEATAAPCSALRCGAARSSPACRRDELLLAIARTGSRLSAGRHRKRCARDEENRRASPSPARIVTAVISPTPMSDAVSVGRGRSRARTTS